MLRRICEDYIVNVLKNHDQLILSCQVELINIFKSKDEVGMIESASMTRKEPDGSAPTNSRFNNLDFVKGSNDIMFLELADIDILGKHLAMIADDYDICVIDTHPDASILTENALAISDMVLIPISLDGFSRDNLNLVIKEIIKLETRCGEINFKVFVNKLKNLRSQRIVYSDLVENHDYPVLETSVSDYSGIQSALLKHAR